MNKDVAIRYGFSKRKRNKVVAEITPDKYFYSNDGQVFVTVRELVNGVNNMSEETFAYHCNDEKNDFRNWVKEVLNRDRFAQLIKNIKTKQEFVDVGNLYLTLIVKKAVKVS